MSAVEFASGLAKRFLNEDRVEGLRNLYFKGRTRLAPLMCRVYGSFDCAALRRHLEQRVGQDF